jgi:hypothetical protein
MFSKITTIYYIYAKNSNLYPCILRMAGRQVAVLSLEFRAAFQNQTNLQAQCRDAFFVVDE